VGSDSSVFLYLPDSTSQMEFEKLRQYRKSKKISLSTLGERIGIDRATIGKWERGETAPMGENLKAWCEALGLELSAIKREGNSIEIHGL
jgi:transcriptional regulator with XRE-family HTH domain